MLISIRDTVMENPHTEHLVSSENAIRFGLPTTVKPADGYFACPVVRCPHGFFCPITLSEHIHNTHLPAPDQEQALRPSRPLKHSLAALLERIDCSGNLSFGLIVCTLCRHAVEPEDLHSHALKHGSYLTGSELRFLVEKMGFIGSHAFFVNQSTPFRLIDGILCFERVYLCTHGCEVAYRSETGLFAHNAEFHGPGDTSYTPYGPFQTVFGYSNEVRRVMSKDESLNEEGEVVDARGEVVYDPNMHFDHRKHLQVLDMAMDWDPEEDKWL